ncbi:methyltransferase [Actinocrinis puniceicyclus]|uniref:Methyltransferase n=1 Tax=Actinocrinis puniceicyclus TaxID=977794 RepID=A0A8J8BBW5_9ACTN|nr:methyltransferase [Actinocrinis puniceicyclus]MBS2962890.1 methyltransferase [Actinocrinis puniceicyclus]
MDGFTPTVSAEEAERIRRWHLAAYQAMKAEGRETQSFAYLGRTITVPPGVMPITRMHDLLGEAVLAEVRESDRVLDMGTGSGVNAILAAGTSRRVLAVDVSAAAVAAARANTKANGVADRVEVRESDVFSAVEGEFDLIVFDPPYRWFAPHDPLEAASTDEDYRALTAFFAEAPGRLAPGGRMLIAFGTSGDLGYLRGLVERQRLRTEVVARRELVRDGVRVEYFVFRLTPPNQPAESARPPELPQPSDM